MKIYKIDVTKKELEKFSEEEKILFFQIPAMLNEINILHKLTYFCNKKGLSDVEEKGQKTQSMFFLSILVGKLYECWIALKKAFFDSKLSKEYENLLSDKGRENLTKLKKYFGKKTWMKDVRDRFCFHYEPKEIAKQISETPEDEVFELYLSEGQGNSLYYMSSVLHTMGILRTIDESDSRLAIDKYFSETSEVAGNFLEFFNHCLVALVEKHLQLDLEEIEIPDPPNISDMYLPYFIKRE